MCKIWVAPVFDSVASVWKRFKILNWWTVLSHHFITSHQPDVDSFPQQKLSALVSAYCQCCCCCWACEHRSRKRSLLLIIVDHLHHLMENRAAAAVRVKISFICSTRLAWSSWELTPLCAFRERSQVRLSRLGDVYLPSSVLSWGLSLIRICHSSFILFVFSFFLG